jgi:methyl-accepting chemotaxis protein
MFNLWMKLKLRNKFLIPTVLLILLGMGASAAISFVSSKNTLSETLGTSMKKTADLSAQMLDGWFKDRSLDVQNWAKQKIYISSVQDTFMGKAAAVSANAQLGELMRGYGYYKNIVLANQAGDVTAAGDAKVVGTLSVKNEPYFKSVIGGEKFTLHLQKNPINGTPELILAALMSETEQTPGVLIAFIEIARIDELFIDRIKVGETGFAYLYQDTGLIIAHPNKQMELTFDLSTSPGFKDWEGKDQGLYEYEFKEIHKWAAFQKLPSFPWKVAVTIEMNEVLAPARKLGQVNLMVTLIAVLTAGLIIYVIANSVAKPINRVVDGLKDAAEGEGDLTKRLVVSSKDEVGDLAKWFNIFIERMQVIIKEVAQNAGQLKQSSGELYEISAALSSGADQTTNRAQSVASASEEMSTNMGNVASTMEQASTNINMVASATEEMSVTISEIAQSTEKARAVTNSAVSHAEGASNQVGELGRAAQEIGKVVETITDISEQVNLLALNATIEAARAGDAGKGFAVVANEIKELAQQTAKATGEIKRQVSAIQSSTQVTVVQINNITKVVSEVDDIVSKIAAAVEEQSTTTREIAGNVAQASQGIGDVNMNVGQSHTVASDIAKEIAEVTHAAGNMSNSSSQVNLNAEQLAKLATQLDGTVGKFKV